jgi:hypothetical protein
MSRIELTLSVGLLPLRELALVVSGDVVDGDVVDGELLLEELLSTVPRTSTLWFTYFERSSLPLALSFKPFAQLELIDDPLVPAVVLGGFAVVLGGFAVEGLVVLALLALAGITFVRTKSPDAGLAVVLALGLVVPVVPAVPDESPFWRQPVTVTVCPLLFCRSLW